MGTRYAGRHRGAHGASEASDRKRGKHHVRVPAKVVRRPVLSASAALALVGASAAGYAKAGDTMSSSTATFTVPAAAVSQANERNTDRLEQTSYRQEASQALSLKQSAAADAVKAQQAADVLRLEAERQVTEERAARDAQRQSVLANAQQDPRSVAKVMLGDFGWGDSQWSCLERLWVGESGWNYKATNSSSGAYGIPQSLPASKMGTVAADYRTNPVTQITWGLQYIRASYGSPCNALGSWNSRSPRWY